MDYGVLVQLVAQSLAVSLQIAKMIEKAEGIKEADKQAMITAIKDAQNGVTFWTENKINT